MEQLLGYSLEDMLLFSRETYLRLFALYHGDLWPAHILAGAFGIAMLRPVLIGRQAQIVAMFTVLAVMWAWVTYGFHLQRYATINWAAEGFAWAFAAQAGLLLLAAIWPGGLRPGAGWARATGVAVFAFALIVLPLAGIALGRDWREAEFFALTPDPMALATLGALIAVSGAWRWPLALIPLGWAAVSTATLHAMGSAEAYVLAAATGVAALALIASAFAARAPAPA